MPLANRRNPAACALAFLLVLSAGWSLLGSPAVARTLEPPSGQTYFGVTDTGVANQFRDFARSVGKHPAVIQTFHPWGNSLHRSMPRWKSIRARPMLHITTTADDGTELITPRQIALGVGDDYLLRLNRSLDRRKILAYIRPMGEPNRCLNAYAGVDCSGDVRGGHYAFRWYKSAFRRIAIIVRGGAKRGTINARLNDIGLPKVQKRRKKVKLPRRLPSAPIAMVWSPLPGGSPTISSNKPSKYWPGKDWVDWVATDFYSRYGSWRDLKRFYTRFALGKDKPFALTEWGLWGNDKPRFVKKIFRFMRSRDEAKMMIYYQDFGSSNEFRIQNFPRSRKILKRNVMKSSFPKFAKRFPR